MCGLGKAGSCSRGLERRYELIAQFAEAEYGLIAQYIYGLNMIIKIISIFGYIYSYNIFNIVGDFEGLAHFYHGYLLMIILYNLSLGALFDADIIGCWPGLLVFA